MSFLLRWLGLGTAASGVGLRPHRDVDLALGYDDAYARVLSAIERALGANVTFDDRSGGMIEAAMGVVNSERIRSTLTRVDDAHTHVRIEAIFPAGVTVPARSAAVEALANMLTASAY